METEKRNLDIKRTNFFLSPYDSIIKDEGIFGLGQSSFIPSTNTIRVLGYSSNPNEVLINNAIMFLPINPTFSHEMGHYQLTSCSRLGMIIKDINAVLQALCLTIIKRMIKKHKKIWIPFSKYLNFHKKDKKIEKLISNILNLYDFENKLIDNWQISQELFAYSWAGLLSTFLFSIWGSVLGPREKQALLMTLESFGLHGDYKKMTEINEKLRNYFLKSGVNQEEIGEKEIRKMFEDLPNIFDEETQLIEAFLKVEETYKGIVRDGKSHEAISRSFDEFLEEYKKKADPEFEKGFNQHIKALELFRKFSKGNKSDFFKIMGVLFVISTFYAPIIDPKLIKNSSDTGKIKKIEDIAENYLKKIISDDKYFSDPKSLLTLIPELYEEINSIKLEEIHKVPISRVLGTRKWFNCIIANLDVNRNERKFLRSLIISNKAIDKHNLMFSTSESIMSLSPVTLRVFIRILFKFKKKLKKKEFARSVFGFLEKLHINDTDTLFKLVNIYQDIFASPLFKMFKSENDVPEIYAKPSFSFFFDGKTISLYSSKDLRTSIGKLSIYRHIVGNIKELCLKEKYSPTLCPICHIRGDYLKKEIDNCWIYKLLRISPEKNNLLICCKKGKAKFYTIQRESENPDQISEFKMNDRSEEMRKTETPAKEDVIQTIWEHEAKKINELFKGRPIRRSSIEGTEYDGTIEDLYEYHQRRIIRFLRKFIFPIMRILLLPFEILFRIIGLIISSDIKIHQKISKIKLKTAKSNVVKTQRNISDLIRLIEETL